MTRACSNCCVSNSPILRLKDHFSGKIGDHPLGHFTLVTLYNVCVVPWGVFSTGGDIMSTMGGYLEYRGGCSVPWGDILSTMGVFSTVGDIMSTVGGYLEYRGGCSVPWGDIMMHVGGYHEYRGRPHRKLSNWTIHLILFCLGTQTYCLN